LIGTCVPFYGAGLRHETRRPFGQGADNHVAPSWVVGTGLALAGIPAVYGQDAEVRFRRRFPFAPEGKCMGLLHVMQKVGSPVAAGIAVYSVVYLPVFCSLRRGRNSMAFERI